MHNLAKLEKKSNLIKNHLKMLKYIKIKEF